MIIVINDNIFVREPYQSQIRELVQQGSIAPSTLPLGIRHPISSPMSIHYPISHPVSPPMPYLISDSVHSKSASILLQTMQLQREKLKPFLDTILDIMKSLQTEKKS